MSVRHHEKRTPCPVTGQQGNKWGETKDGLIFVYGDHSPLPGWRYLKEGSNGCLVYRHESTVIRPSKPRKPVCPPTPVKARLDIIHPVYEALLSATQLSDDQWEDLKEERPGLCSHHRADIGYLPPGNTEKGRKARRRIASEVERLVSLVHGITRAQLLRVPGFEEQGGKLTVKGWGGHLLAYRNVQGQIFAVQTRKENPKPGDSRYSWWTGVSARPGVLLPPQQKRDEKPVWCHIAEGMFKALALQTQDSHNPVMVVPGLSSPAIPELVSEMGAKAVCLWIDADWQWKPEVRKQLDKLIYNLRNYPISIAVWDGGKGKGIDDYLAAGGLLENIEFLSPDQWKELAEIEAKRAAGTLPTKKTFRSKKAFQLWSKYIIESGGFLPGFHFFRIPTGWGKTYTMAGATKGGSVCVSAPKRSIVAPLATRFDAVHYDECPDKFGNIMRVATCFPSLPRAVPGQYKSVVFDELSESLNQLDSSIIKDANSVLSAMTYLMNQAESVLIADAYITDEHIEAIAKLTGTPLESFHVYEADERAKPKAGETLALHPSPDALTVEVKQAVESGENVAIFCTTAAQAEQLSVMFRETGYKALLVTGDTENDLSDVNTLWTEYQIVIASPAVTSGVSYDEEHFDRVFLYGEQFNDGSKGRRAVTEEGILQMSARIRQTKQNRIDAFLSDAWDSSNDLESIEQEALSMLFGDKLTKDELRQTGAHMPESSLSSPDVVSISTCRHIQTKHSQDLKHGVQSRWRREGGTVLTIKPDSGKVQQVKEERKQTAAKVQQVKCERIVNAEAIEPLEAEHLERKAYLSPDESDSLTRYRISADRPGFDSWSPEEQQNAVTSYPQDRAAAKRLELADAYVRGDVKALNRDDMERAQAGGVTLDHNGPRMELFDKLLRLAGFSLEQVIKGESFEWNRQTLESRGFGLSAMILLESTPRSVRGGLHRGRISNDHGSRLLSSLFRSLGFNNESKRIRIKGKQVSHQTASPAIGFEIWKRWGEEEKCAVKTYSTKEALLTEQAPFFLSPTEPHGFKTVD